MKKLLLTCLCALLLLSIRAQQTFSPIADTRVSGLLDTKSTPHINYRDSNYGSTEDLQVKFSYPLNNGSDASLTSNLDRITFLKFDMSAYNLAGIGSAVLRLYCFKKDKADVTIKSAVRVWAVSDNNWAENTVTYNMRPKQSIPLTVRSISSVETYYDFDITEYLKSLNISSTSNTVISLALTGDDNNENGASFYSKENLTNTPQLVLSETPLTQQLYSGTYYVDNTVGNDSNDGLSPATAWQTIEKINSIMFQPGAKILFKSGVSWVGELHPLGWGNDASVITIDKYGSGVNPIINGDGSAYSGALFLYNQPYWDIKNLTLTNYSAAQEGGKSAEQWKLDAIKNYVNVRRPSQFDNQNDRRFGALILANDASAVKHTHLENLEVRDVNGKINHDDGSSIRNGGIYISVVGNLVPTWFDDIKVEGCYIHDVDRTGIYLVASTWDDRTFTINTNWTPSKNIVIRKNRFERSGANALLVANAAKPLMEYNLFEYCAIKGTGNAAFNFNTDDAIWQYNESRYTVYNDHDGDAGGIDADYNTKNTILQYNYIHDNDYGILITGGPTTVSFNNNTVVRYNIFENDGKVASGLGHQFAIRLDGKTTNTHIYNNVIFTDKVTIDLDALDHKFEIFYHSPWDNQKPSLTEYKNNIIYNTLSSPCYRLQSSTGNVFDYNLYYSTNTIFDKAPDAHGINADPLFVKPGNENPSGNNPDGNGNPNGYKLKPGSPALSAGAIISSNGGRDYFGLPVWKTSVPSIGVYNGTATAILDPDPKFHIYLLAGEANMSGRATLTSAELAKGNARIKMLTAGNNWVQAKNPIHTDASAKVGPGMQFALDMIASDPTITIGLVPAAVGNTSIDAWVPGKYTASVSKSVYDDARNRTNIARLSGVLKGVLFLQGESDKASASVADWTGKTSALIANFRTDFKDPSLPVLLGEIASSSGTGAAINNQIAAIVNTTNYTKLIASSALSVNTGTDLFDNIGANALGDLYAQAMKEVEVYKELAPIGKVIAVKADNGKYLSPDLASSSLAPPVTANKIVAGETEHFMVEAAPGSTIVLKGYNGLYLNSKYGNSSMLNDNPAATPLSRFTWIDQPGSAPNGFSLRGNNGSYVDSRSGTEPLLCTATAIAAPEKFNWENILLSPTISFAALSDKTIGDTFKLAATTNTNGYLSFASNNTAVARVKADTIFCLSAGSATITATLVGDDRYYPAMLSQSFTVNKKAQIISFTLPAVTYDDAPLTLAASTTATGATTFAYESDNHDVATVSGNTLTIVGAGTAIITASNGGNETYSPASASQVLTVNKANQSITFNPITAKFLLDDDFNPGALASSTLPVIYTSSSNAIVTGSLISLKTAGTVTITATQPGNNNYNSAPPVSQSFDVTNQKTLQPIADSYVRNINFAGDNFGNEPVLFIKNDLNTTTGYYRESFLKFDLDPVSKNGGAIQSASLKLTCSTSAQGTLKAFAVADDSWSETGINYTNRPQAGSTAIGSRFFSATTPFLMDLSSYITDEMATAAKLASICLKDLNTVNPISLQFFSKEAVTDQANKPALVVTVTKSGNAGGSMSHTGTTSLDVSALSSPPASTIPVNQAPGQFQVYPNPSDGRFTINLAGAGISSSNTAASITIIDPSGAKRFYTIVPKGLSLIPIEAALEPGWYVVVLSCNGKNYAEKILIK